MANNHLYVVVYVSCSADHMENMDRNNMPVFFIRDGIQFPDMVHAFKVGDRSTYAMRPPVVFSVG
jgi:Catalase